MPISTNDLRPGITILIDDQIYIVLEAQHVKLGRGGAYVRTRLRHLLSGNVLERNFRSGEEFEQAIVERRSCQFLYRQRDEFVFLDNETFDQYSLTADQIGEAAQFLAEGGEATVVFHEEHPLTVELPTTADLEVVETDPGFRGDTVSGGSKPARLKTGAVVQVPFFINVGDIIRVDTRTGRYIERVRSG
ncbi:MAG: elongation factor P [Armatimonadetes bacterium]|nr:elongation factor P [Armatimonadota bacterium]MDW8120939.1 elongation factor P [Armatimonadota bacterium]